MKVVGERNSLATLSMQNKMSFEIFEFIVIFYSDLPSSASEQQSNKYR